MQSNTLQSKQVKPIPEPGYIYLHITEGKHCAWSAYKVLTNMAFQTACTFRGAVAPLRHGIPRLTY